MGLIKFGSRVDVFFGPEWEIAVKTGQRVSAGSSILARRKTSPHAALMARSPGANASSTLALPTTAPAAPPTRCPPSSPPAISFSDSSPSCALSKAPCRYRRTPRTQSDFEVAAKAIGAAVVLDGLDGRIARMTNTVSDFGREMDSLADVITFGIAPAVLAYTWGVEFVQPARFLPRITAPATSSRSCFCCAAPPGWPASTCRPIPCQESRPARSQSISSVCRSLPPPAMVAAIVFAADGEPLQWWILSSAGWRCWRCFRS